MTILQFYNNFVPLKAKLFQNICLSYAKTFSKYFFFDQSEEVNCWCRKNYLQIRLFRNLENEDGFQQSSHNFAGGTF